MKQELVAERTKTTRVLQGAEDERDAKRGLVDSLGELKRELIRYLLTVGIFLHSCTRADCFGVMITVQMRERRRYSAELRALRMLRGRRMLSWGG